MPRHDVHIPTLSGLAALAIIAASVAHEVLGHGAACLLSGGHITLLTTVYFRCSPGTPFVDAGGSVMNLLVSMAAFVALVRVRDSVLQVFLAFVVAFNGFWAAGTVLSSAVTGAGDWAFVLRGAGASGARVVLEAVGVALYAVTLRAVARWLPGGWPLVVAYLVAAGVVGASVFFYPGPRWPALRGALLEGLLAPVGLLVVAWRGRRRSALRVSRRRLVVVAAVIVVVVYWVLEGHGLVRGVHDEARAAGGVPHLEGTGAAIANRIA